MKDSVKLIFASALLLVAASCAKEVSQQVPGESLVRFDIGVEGTKASLVNSETDNTFKTSGFSVIAYEGTTKKMDNVAVTNTSGTWKTATDYYWKKNTEMTFYAFYPQTLATSLDSKTTNAGIAPFTYSPLASGVTADVTGQTDYMLATYSGTGNNGVAELSFKHPLASIQFAVGNVHSSLTAINSISLGGFYTSGTCKSTCTMGEVRYAWTDTQGKAASGALSQIGLSPTIEYDSLIGEPFLLIPQIFSTDSKLEIVVNATIGGVSKILIAEVPAENFLMLESGMTTKLNINYGGTAGNALTFTASIIDWVGASSDLAMKEKETPPDPKDLIPDLSRIDFLTSDAISRSTANCYVVTETGEYKLPLVYGNAFTNGSLNTSAYANGLFITTAYLKPFVDHAGNEISSPYILKQTNLSEENCTAEVLWEGKSGMIIPIEGETSLLVENGMLYFKVNQLESNAVIQLKSAGKVLWSWHIWATAKSNLSMVSVNVPAQDDQPAKTYKILNCNIGATAADKYGTVYQWGRRNALRSTETGSIPGPVAIKDSYNDLPVNPQGSGVWCSTFYINNWDSANINWGTSRVIVPGLKHTKTIYDPCPAGFYVPSVDCFTGFTTSNFSWSASPAGRTYGGSLFPAKDGEGRYWLSAPITEDDLGSLLHFSSSTVNGKTTGSRALCNPIRPQKIEE